MLLILHDMQYFRRGGGGGPKVSETGEGLFYLCKFNIDLFQAKVTIFS